MIAVLDYGIGNLRSAEKALQRVGGDARLVTNAHDIKAADAVVMPGVGSFGACVDALTQSSLDVAARDAIERGMPFLGICVGLQMLFESSQESPKVQGLGVFRGQITRIDTNEKLPQMQWNKLALHVNDPLFNELSEPWMYFVHSFSAPMSEHVIASVDYGTSVVAALRKDNVWAVQFHPEKSSNDGLKLLRNFVEYADAH